LLRIKIPKYRFALNRGSVYLCAFFVALAALFLFNAYFFSGLAKELSALYSQRKSMEEQLAIKNNNLADFEENLRILEKNAQSAPRQISPEKEPEALVYILNLIEEHGFTEHEFQILPRRLSDETLLRPVSIDVLGTYDNCMLFLNALQQGEYSCIADKVEMSRSSDENEDFIYMSVRIYLIIAVPTDDFTDDSADDSAGGSMDNSTDDSADSSTDDSAGITDAKTDTEVGDNARNPFDYAK